MSCKINRIAKSVAFFDEDPIGNAAICSGFSILSCVCVRGAIYFLMRRYNNEFGPSCTCSLILVGYVILFFFPSQARQVEFGRVEPSETLDVSLVRLKFSAYLHRARAIKDGIHFGNAIEIQLKV